MLGGGTLSQTVLWHIFYVQTLTVSKRSSDKVNCSKGTFEDRVRNEAHNIVSFFKICISNCTENFKIKKNEKLKKYSENELHV